MQSLGEEEKRQVLGSVLADQLSAIQEAVKDVPEIKKQLADIDVGLHKLTDDLNVIKAAINSISEQVNHHERQIAEIQTI